MDKGLSWIILELQHLAGQRGYRQHVLKLNWSRPTSHRRWKVYRHNRDLIPFLTTDELIRFLSLVIHRMRLAFSNSESRIMELWRFIDLIEAEEFPEKWDVVFCNPEEEEAKLDAFNRAFDEFCQKIGLAFLDEQQHLQFLALWDLKQAMIIDEKSWVTGLTITQHRNNELRFWYDLPPLKADRHGRLFTVTPSVAEEALQKLGFSEYNRKYGITYYRLPLTWRVDENNPLYDGVPLDTNV